MRHKLLSWLIVFSLLSAGSNMRLAIAEDVLDKASGAVTNIIFDYGADEFATYTVQENGFVDINFATNTPDALYSEILNKLQNHPDIKGVLAGKTGPVCPLF